MDIHIRKAEDTDQNAIVELNSLTSDKTLNEYSKHKNDLFLVNIYYQNGGYFWVAEDLESHKLVGMVGLKRVNNVTGKVKALRVHPNYQRQGIAKQLMETLEKYCLENNFKEIILGVNAKTTAAVKLYESLGYSLYEEKTSNITLKIEYYRKNLH